MDVSVYSFLALLFVVALLRLVELRISKRHQREMAAHGAAKVDEPKFRWMVLLHAAVLLGATGSNPPAAPLDSVAGCADVCPLPRGERRALVGHTLARGALERSGRGFHAPRRGDHRAFSLRSAS